MNIGGTQVGHVPRQTAAKLAPLLDRRAISIEGVMLEGNCKCFLAQFRAWGFTKSINTRSVTGFSYSLSM